VNQGAYRTVLAYALLTVRQWERGNAKIAGVERNARMCGIMARRPGGCAGHGLS
jgi:hypothetical protein